MSYKVAAPFWIAISKEWTFLLLHILMSIWCCQCSHFYNSNRCVMVVHCCFNLHFSDEILCWASFHMLICRLYIFFGEVSIKVFGHFFLLGCLFSYCWGLRILCIIWYQSFIKCAFYKCFLPACGFCSHSLYSVFGRTKVFISLKSVQLINSFFHGLSLWFDMLFLQIQIIQNYGKKQKKLTEGKILKNLNLYHDFLL